MMNQPVKTDDCLARYYRWSDSAQQLVYLVLYVSAAKIALAALSSQVVWVHL